MVDELLSDSGVEDDSFSVDVDVIITSVGVVEVVN